MKKQKPFTKPNIIREVNNLADDFMDDDIKGVKQREQFIGQVIDYCDPKNGLVSNWEGLYNYVDGLLTKFPLK